MGTMDSFLCGVSSKPFFLYFAALLFLSLLPFPSAFPQNPTHKFPSNSSSSSGQINSNSILVALLDSHYTELAELVEKALLLQKLEDTVGVHNITIFAPRNEALEHQLDPEFKRFLLEPGNLKSLQTLLMYHIVPKRIGSNDWPAGNSKAIPHQTLCQDHVHLMSKGPGKKIVGLVKIVCPDDYGIVWLLVPRSIQEDMLEMKAS